MQRSWGILTVRDSGELGVMIQGLGLATALALLSVTLAPAAYAQPSSVAETLSDLPCENTIYASEVTREMPVTSKSVPFNGRVYDTDRSQIVCYVSPDYKGGALIKIGERFALDDATLTIWNYDDPARTFQVELTGRAPRADEILMDCKGYRGGRKPYLCDLYMDAQRGGILRVVSNQPDYIGFYFHLASYPGRNYNGRVTDIDTSQPVTVSGVGQTLPLEPVPREYGFAGDATRFQSKPQGSAEFFKALMQTKDARADFIYSANASQTGGSTTRRIPVNIPRIRVAGPLIGDILSAMHRNEERRDP
ncbi:MAG: hypothetical protein AAGA34_15160 [Pseudomonadota bacterium]